MAILRRELSEEEWIAERTLWAVDKNGRGFDIGLQIGRPYQTDSAHGDWACPVALIGFHGRFPDMQGDDSWQALVLAFDLTKKILDVFVEIEGGKLFSEKDGPEITVDEAFGIPYKTPDEEPIDDGPLTPEQEASAGRLTADELAMIDAAILRNCSQQFRKIARVVGLTMDEVKDAIPSLPDVFFADRVRHLVAAGKLESQGNIEAMRFGEVRLSSTG